MKPNASSLLCAVLTTFVAGMPVAFASAEFDDVARVISVTEKTERVNTPREECTSETVNTTTTTPAPAASGDRDLAGAVIGGLAGAIIGSQVGKGNGKAAGAAVGAATGAIVGDRISNRDGSGGGSVTTTTPHTIQRCRMIDSWQTRSLGFEVTYQYRGKSFTEVLPFSPGSNLRLRVLLTPQR